MACRGLDLIAHGRLYPGGSWGLSGGGYGRSHGVFLTNKDAAMSASDFLIYCDGAVAAAAQLTGVNVTQGSWNEVGGDRPSEL